MKVWATTWDVSGTETGFEIFADMSLAIEAAVGYAREMCLFDEEGMSADEARAALRTEGELNFDDLRCYYSVSEHEVVDRLS
jgi:hypothetical protein